MKSKVHERKPHTAADEALDHPFHLTEEAIALREVTDEDLETFLFEEEEKPRGFINLPTITGLSMIGVGIAYLFQEFGLWSGFDLGTLVSMLPWLAGILIILLGFGVLSWKPKKKKAKTRVRDRSVDDAIKRAQQEIRQAIQSGQHKTSAGSTAAAPPVTGKKRLTRSANKKITGVCAGIAEYFNIDPTIVRILFVVGVFVGWGTAILLYIILSIVMPDAPHGPGASKTDDRFIKIISE